MDIKESVKDQNDVGLRILNQLLLKDESKGKNLVFSPLSIYMMLTLLAAGASNGQIILRDLLSFLNFNSIDQLNSFLSKLFSAVFGDTSATGGPCVTTANGVWIADDLPVKKSFENLLQTLYNGKLNQVDFVNKSAEIIEEANAWVNKETRGLIPTIVDRCSVRRTTRMILANAVYFKAKWTSQFYDGLTKNADFHLLNGSSVNVPFMSSSDNQLISVFDGFKVAFLSYNSRDYNDDDSDYNDDNNYNDDNRCFSMLIFLPDDRDGLPSLIERACSESGFLDRHQPPPFGVAVEKFKIPKFKFGLEFKTVEILQDLGLGSLFSESGFTEMVEDPAGRELYISNMFHKAVICVNEKGTEAAAVTVCDMLGCCLDMDPVRIKFVADHPFFFVIKEKVSGALLFIGQVIDPSDSD